MGVCASSRRRRRRDRLEDRPVELQPLGENQAAPPNANPPGVPDGVPENEAGYYRGKSFRDVVRRKFHYRQQREGVDGQDEGSGGARGSEGSEEPEEPEESEETEESEESEGSEESEESEEFEGFEGSWAKDDGVAKSTHIERPGEARMAGKGGGTQGGVETQADGGTQGGGGTQADGGAQGGRETDGAGGDEDTGPPDGHAPLDSPPQSSNEGTLSPGEWMNSQSITAPPAQYFAGAQELGRALRSGTGLASIERVDGNRTRYVYYEQADGEASASDGPSEVIEYERTASGLLVRKQPKSSLDPTRALYGDDGHSSTDQSVVAQKGVAMGDAINEESIPPQQAETLEADTLSPRGSPGPYKSLDEEILPEDAEPLVPPESA